MASDLLDTRTIAFADSRRVSRSYRFHDLFRLSIHSDEPKALRHFQDEYGAFEDGISATPDLDVTVSKFAMQPRGTVQRFGSYYLADDWIYGRERYKVARWQFALKGLEAPTTQLLFHGGMFALDFLQHRFVEQIMRYKLCQRDCLLVHGGCVASNGGSVLFPGLGHSGKTALALRQVLAGRQFQADDYTFVSASGSTYSYPRRLHVSDHMRAACPAAMWHLSRKHQLSIKVKKLIYHLSLKYGSLEEALRLQELVPGAKVEKVARLRGVLLLTSHAGAELKGPHPLRQEELINRVMAINSLEGKPFYDLLLSHQFHSNTPALDEWSGRERDILRRGLASVPGYEVLVPRQAPDPGAILEQTARILDRVLE